MTDSCNQELGLYAGPPPDPLGSYPRGTPGDVGCKGGLGWGIILFEEGHSGRTSGITVMWSSSPTSHWLEESGVFCKGNISARKTTTSQRFTPHLLTGNRRARL